MPKIKVKIEGAWHDTSQVDWEFRLVYIDKFTFAVDFEDVEAYEIVEYREKQGE